MTHRYCTFLTVLLLSACFAESALAKVLTNSDLRRFGFSGRYVGDADGFIKERDDDEFDYDRINQRVRERLPVRRRSIVTGPSGRNGFYLVRKKVTGNDRRITVRMYYSGRSYNPDYKKEMIGSGSKVLKVRKFRGSRDQFEMKLKDRLSERGVNNGKYYTQWNVSGLLFK